MCSGLKDVHLQRINQLFVKVKQNKAFPKSFFFFWPLILLLYLNYKSNPNILQLFDDLLNGDLSGHPSYFANVTGYNYYFNYLMTEEPKDMEYFNKYVQLPKVRRGIHVGNMTWNDGKMVENHMINDVMDSVKPWIEELLEHYKVMIYNGLMDVIIAWPLTENFISSMKWSGAHKYLTAERTEW